MFIHPKATKLNSEKFIYAFFFNMILCSFIIIFPHVKFESILKSFFLRNLKHFHLKRFLQTKREFWPFTLECFEKTSQIADFLKWISLSKMERLFMPQPNSGVGAHQRQSLMIRLGEAGLRGQRLLSGLVDSYDYDKHAMGTFLPAHGGYIIKRLSPFLTWVLLTPSFCVSILKQSHLGLASPYLAWRSLFLLITWARFPQSVLGVRERRKGNGTLTVSLWSECKLGPKGSRSKALWGLRWSEVFGRILNWNQKISNKKRFRLELRTKRRFVLEKREVNKEFRWPDEGSRHHHHRLHPEGRMDQVKPLKVLPQPPIDHLVTPLRKEKTFKCNWGVFPSVFSNYKRPLILEGEKGGGVAPFRGQKFVVFQNRDEMA